jgi:hypothetical protein
MSITDLGVNYDPTAIRTKINAIISDLNTLTAYGYTYDATTVLSPEYPGIVWARYAPGTAYYGYGYQTEDDVPDAVNLATAGGRNCYVWTSADGNSASCYGSLRWTLPANFSAWATNAIQLEMYTTDGSGDSTLSVACYQDTTLRDNSTISSATSNATWGTKTLTSTNILGGGWSAGEVLTMQFTFTTTGTKEVRLGDLTLGWTGSISQS